MPEVVRRDAGKRGVDKRGVDRDGRAVIEIQRIVDAATSCGADRSRHLGQRIGEL